MKKWIQAFRLRTLPLSFSTILAGNALAYLFWFDQFKSIVLWLTLLTTLFLQILSNLANDYGDASKGADNENRIGPQRAIQSGAISAKKMKAAIFIFVFLSLISGLALLFLAFENFNLTYIVFTLIGILAIAAAIKYTMGKGAYGYSGLGDVFVFVFFGLVGVCGSYYLQTGEINLWSVALAVSIGCFSTAVLNLNNMRDIENDKAVGKNTLVVRLGAVRAKRYHVLLFIFAWFAFPLHALIFFDSYYFLILFLPLPLHALHLIKVSHVQKPAEFDPELKKIALSSFLFSALLWLTVYFLDVSQ